MGGGLSKNVKEGKVITNEMLLMGSCRIGDSHSVEELHNLGKVDVNKPFDTGYTPSFYAAFHGRANVIRALHECGADLSAPCDRAGSTPMAWARQQGHVEVVQELKILPKQHKLIERGRWAVFQDDIKEFHHKIDHYQVKFHGKLPTDVS